jgi:hypothetical protein
MPTNNDAVKGPRAARRLTARRSTKSPSQKEDLSRGAILKRALSAAGDAAPERRRALHRSGREIPTSRDVEAPHVNRIGSALLLGVVIRPHRLPPTAVVVFDDLKPADRSRTARIAPSQIVERELDSPRSRGSGRGCPCQPRRRGSRGLRMLLARPHGDDLQPCKTPFVGKRTSGSSARESPG